MKNISILKGETFESIAEKALQNQETEITLRVPKGTILATHAKYLRGIAKAARDAGKTITIESVDDGVLSFAKQAGLMGTNPFFSTMQQFSDIVPKQASPSALRAMAEKRKKDIVTESSPVHVDVQNIAREEEVSDETLKDGIYEHDVLNPEARWRWMRGLLILGGGLAIVVGGIIAWTLSATATIIITRDREPWTYQGDIIIDPTISTMNISARKIPGQLFELRERFENKFLATGVKSVEQKATGTITIWNAYNTQAQFLIKNTRFETPDGKIYRIINDVTVPGGRMVSGRLEPGSITASVAADQPGESYNIGPIQKFTIPGFKDNAARFAGFYGSSSGPMTGGFVGVVTYPTPDDIAKAEAEFRRTSESALASKLLSQVPKDLLSPTGARAFRFVTITTDDIAGNDKRFTIRGEGELRVFAFRESDMNDMLAKLGEQNVGFDKEMLELTVTYERGSAVGQSSALALPVRVTGTFVSRVNFDEVRAFARGKRATDVAETIVISGVSQKPTVTVRPFWIRRVPGGDDRIRIELR